MGGDLRGEKQKDIKMIKLSGIDFEKKKTIKDWNTLQVRFIIKNQFSW